MKFKYILLWGLIIAGFPITICGFAFLVGYINCLQDTQINPCDMHQLFLIGFGITWDVWSITKYASNADSLIFLHENDTLGAAIYYHSGGDPGDQPDSTRWFPVDSLR